MTTFGCAATCMDGRIQAAVRKHIRAHYSVDAVDIVAQPGMNKFLAENKYSPIPLVWLLLYCITLFIFVILLRRMYNRVILWNIRKMIGISVLNHRAKVLAIVGHAECAGNTCSKEVQIMQLEQAKRVAESFGFEVPIILLWVCEDWKTVHVIGDNASIDSIHSYDVRLAKPR